MTQPKLLDRVRAVARLRHLSLSTERTYADWIRRFILFRRKRHPSEVGAEEIRQLLPHLAVKGEIAVLTQNVGRKAMPWILKGRRAGGAEYYRRATLK